MALPHNFCPTFGEHFRADTLEQIARKLNISPAGFLSDGDPSAPCQIAPPLLDTLEAVSHLSVQDRQQFYECFLHLLHLLDQENRAEENEHRPTAE